jgi:hypothetical protein
MARIVTPPATVTHPAARTLDAPEGRPDYPLVRPAAFSPAYAAPDTGAVTRALERLAGLRLKVTAIRLDAGCGQRTGRALAEALGSALLLTEFRPGLGLVALYVGPRPAGPEGERVLAARIAEDLTRALFVEHRYGAFDDARIAMVHCEVDALTDGMLDQALRAETPMPLVDLLPRAA